jgi:hypothetical protein
VKKGKNNSFENLFETRAPEFVTAALLLSGQLSVHRVLVGRDGEVEVRIVGEFKKPKNHRVNELYNFLKNNGDISIDQVMEALKQRLNE